MSALDIKTKLAMMIDQLQTSKRMLDRDDIRPDVKQRLEEDIAVLKVDIRELYIELFKLNIN
jgi:hypothetical protein